MAVIYLTHPIHGAKVAIAEAEAIYDETHGWMRYDPELNTAGEGDILPKTRKRQSINPPTGVT